MVEFAISGLARQGDASCAQYDSDGKVVVVKCLPHTGHDVAAQIGAGSALLLGGVALLVAVKRRWPA